MSDQTGADVAMTAQTSAGQMALDAEAKAWAAYDAAMEAAGDGSDATLWQAALDAEWAALEASEMALAALEAEAA